MNLNMPDETRAKLAACMELLQSDTETETIRRAIDLLHTLLIARDDGEWFAAVDRDGNQREIVFT